MTYPQDPRAPTHPIQPANRPGGCAVRPTHRAADCDAADRDGAYPCGANPTRPFTAGAYPCRANPARPFTAEVVLSSVSRHANVKAATRKLAGRKPALHGAARHERTAGPARRQTIHPRVEGSEGRWRPPTRDSPRGDHPPPEGDGGRREPKLTGEPVGVGDHAPTSVAARRRHPKRPNVRAIGSPRRTTRRARRSAAVPHPTGRWAEAR